MSSWLDPFVDSLADKLGLKTRRNTLNDALRQDPGAESEVGRTMTGVSPPQWDAMRAEKLLAPVQVHGMEAVRQVPANRPVVTLPPVNMVPEQDPRQMIAGQSTPLASSEAPFNSELLHMLQAAEDRSGVAPDKTSYGRGNGRGGTTFFSPQQGRDMDEDEARAYLDLLEGR